MKVKPNNFYIMDNGDIIPFAQITLFRNKEERDKRSNGDIALSSSVNYGLGKEYDNVKIAYIDWLNSHNIFVNEA